MSAGILGLYHLDGNAGGPVQSRIDWWRGAVASRFRDQAEFHGHDADGNALHRFPPVQYRQVNGALAVFAMGSAMEALLAYPWPGERLRLGIAELSVTEVQWKGVRLDVAVAPTLIRYEFGAPWLPLNQENFERFRSMAHAEQAAELDRVLVGNLLSLSKGLGIRLQERIYAAAIPVRPTACRLKDVVLRGYWGGFATNLDLGDDLAIGKAVSRGFGWFRRAGRV